MKQVSLTKKHKQASTTQTFADHISELRDRLMVCALSLLGGSVLGYVFYDKIEAALIRPLNETLYYSTPGGGFNFMIQVCLLVGVLITVPVLVYNLLRFLEPAIVSYRSMRTSVLFAASLGLLATGISFAYFISLPAALNFLNGFSSLSVKALITTKDYLNFSGIYIGGYALLFQLPLILLFIDKIKPLDPGSLLRNTKFVVLAAFMVAALLTPTTDPMNQAIMAGPIIALYLVSIILIWAKRLRFSRKYKAAKKQAVSVMAQPETPVHLTPMQRGPAQAQPIRPMTSTLMSRPSRPRLVQL